MSKSRFSLRNIRTVGAQREIEDRLARFTNPDPLCPKCGQHHQFCEHKHQFCRADQSCQQEHHANTQSRI